MRWFSWTVIFALLAVWQVSCWTTHAFLFYQLSFFPTVIAAFASEAVLSRWDAANQEGEARKRLSWAMYCVALLIPVFPPWQHLFFLVLAVFALRLFTTGFLRHVVPCVLVTAALCVTIALAPWGMGARFDAVFGWCIGLVGLLVLAYEIWLLRRSRDCPSTGNTVAVVLLDQETSRVEMRDEAARETIAEKTDVGEGFR
jgi:hypothetical protein